MRIIELWRILLFFFRWKKIAQQQSGLRFPAVESLASQAPQCNCYQLEIPDLSFFSLDLSFFCSYLKVTIWKVSKKVREGEGKGENKRKGD